jgi:hypothetical protein
MYGYGSVIRTAPSCASDRTVPSLSPTFVDAEITRHLPDRPARLEH